MTELEQEYRNYIVVKAAELPHSEKYHGLSRDEQYTTIATEEGLGIPMGSVPMTEEEVEYILGLPQVVSVEEVQVFSIPRPPAVTAAVANTINGPTAMEFHNIPALWDEGLKGNGVKVAVLDTGIDETHAETTFNGRIAAIESFVGDDGFDRQGHGTWCAGAVAAAVESYGAAPECTLLIGKVLGDDGSGPTDGIIQGVEWAVQQGAQVISMSLGGPGTPTSPLSVAVNSASLKDVVVVCAAGNDGFVPGMDDIGSPGDAAGAECVRAVDLHGQPAFFSSDGPHPGVGALGCHTLGLGLNGAIEKDDSGTSMATPRVAGVAALLVQARFHARKVRLAINAGARDPHEPPSRGRWGVMDAKSSLDLLNRAHGGARTHA